MDNSTLSKERNFWQLILFAMPSICTMVFLSLYTIADGFFVARFVSSEALSAINIVFPVQCLIVGISVMFATGGSAVVAKLMGEEQEKEANSAFTYLAVFGTALACFISLISVIFIEPILVFLGATPSILELCIEYLSVILYFTAANFLQTLFQVFFITASKPNLSLILSILAGVCNIVFDYIFIVIMDMGIMGAAYATVMGYCVPSIGGVIFFLCNRKGLHFTKFKTDNKMILQSCMNGSSEMVTNLANSVTTFMYNVIMMHFAGTDGVAAITVVLYCQFTMVSIALGFSIGVSPIFSYHYGACNFTYLKQIYKMAIKFILGSSVAMFFVALFSADFFANAFAGDNLFLRDMSANGLRLFSFSFLFAGFNILTSAIFTAFSNGKLSAAISFSRTFLFTIVCTLLLSWWFGTTGLFLGSAAAEFITVIFAVYMHKKALTNYFIQPIH